MYIVNVLLISCLTYLCFFEKAIQRLPWIQYMTSRGRVAMGCQSSSELNVGRRCAQHAGPPFLALFPKKKHQKQGLVTVPFWEYWTSPEKVAIIDHIPNVI